MTFNYKKNRREIIKKHWIEWWNKYRIEQREQRKEQRRTRKIQQFKQYLIENKVWENIHVAWNSYASKYQSNKWAKVIENRWKKRQVCSDEFMKIAYAVRNHKRR